MCACVRVCVCVFLSMCLCVYFGPSIIVVVASKADTTEDDDDMMIGPPISLAQPVTEASAHVSHC